MLIGEILKRAKLELPADMLAVEVLLAFVLKKDRSYLVANIKMEIDQEMEREFWRLFERLKTGEPLAYLINLKEFFGLDFYVDQRVLIPRPETELLVEKVLALAEQGSGKLRILDVGTGSGCIAISLAKNLPGAQVLGIDLSVEALTVAKINLEKCGLNRQVSFYQSDLLEQISAEEKFDVIVANLPYIGLEKFNSVAESVRKFEPATALFAGDDGLDLYRKLFTQVHGRRWNFKLFLGEFGFGQENEIRNLAKTFFPERNLEICPDYAKIERVFMVS